MYRFERSIGFSDVDMARVVFFPHFAAFCHETLEALLGTLPGGYPRMVGPDDTGIPTVHFSIDFQAPLRYGDVAVIDLTVERVGRSSVTCRYEIRRRVDDVHCATVRHTIVTARMSTFETVPVPPAIRRVFEAHLAPSGPA